MCVSLLGVCPSLYICVVFVFQSPDKKKVLTSQRTFDSEGERDPSVLVSPPVSLRFTLGQYIPFFKTSI